MSVTLGIGLGRGDTHGIDWTLLVMLEVVLGAVEKTSNPGVARLVLT